LLQHEEELNSEIATSIESFEAGANVVEYIKLVNAAERQLRKLEADAATKRVLNAQRDALVAQLDYLLQMQNSGAADVEAQLVKSARASVETSFEKEAALQQKSIDSAIRALKEGTIPEDGVAPLFAKAVEKARADVLAKPAAKPFTNAQQASSMSTCKP
jgi:hypothetical protein